MTPEARIRHLLADRTRIAIDAMRHRSDYFARLRDELGALPQVHAVTVNARTASVLLQHESGALEHIARLARERELFDIAVLECRVESGIGRAAAGLGWLDTVLRRNTRGELNAESMVYLLLIALAIAQIARGQIMAPAATLLWYALEVLTRNRPGGR